jgi:hypothetical protein
MVVPTLFDDDELEGKLYTIIKIGFSRKRKRSLHP